MIRLQRVLGGAKTQYYERVLVREVVRLKIEQHISLKRGRPGACRWDPGWGRRDGVLGSLWGVLPLLFDPGVFVKVCVL